MPQLLIRRCDCEPGCKNLHMGIRYPAMGPMDGTEELIPTYILPAAAIRNFATILNRYADALDIT